MKKNKPSEALLWKKVVLLRQQFKLLQREERIYKKRNRKLANKIQSQKEQLKELDDERVNLQKEIFDQQYDKNISGAENTTLHNNLSSVLKDVHTLQAKIIGSWRENHVEQYLQSSRKNYSSESYSIPKDQRVSKQGVTESDLFLSQEISQCLEKDVNQVGIPVNQQSAPESIISLSSLDDDSRSLCDDVQYLDMVCKTEKVSARKSDPVITGKVSIKSSDDDLQTTDDFPASYPELSKCGKSDSPVEAFHGFVEDFNAETKFTEMIERLSSTCDMLDTLRDNENAQSLSVFATIPETSSSLPETRWLKEFTIQSVEVSVPKLDLKPLPSYNCSLLSTENIEREIKGNDNSSHYAMDRKAPNVSPDSSSQDTASGNRMAEAEEVSEQKASRKKALILRHSKNDPSSPKRSALTGCASDPVPNGREPRRARGAVVSYKEKSLNVKLRRN